MILSCSQSEYVLALLELGCKNIKQTRISEELNVSKPSVTSMMQKMSSMGIVNIDDEKGVSLTEHGFRIALQIQEQYESIYLFFFKYLKLGEKESKRSTISFIGTQSDKCIYLLKARMDCIYSEDIILVTNKLRRVQEWLSRSNWLKEHAGIAMESWLKIHENFKAG